MPLSICSRPLSSPLARPANPSPGTGVRIRHEDLLDMGESSFAFAVENEECHIHMQVVPQTRMQSSSYEPLACCEPVVASLRSVWSGKEEADSPGIKLCGHACKEAWGKELGDLIGHDAHLEALQAAAQRMSD